MLFILRQLVIKYTISFFFRSQALNIIFLYIERKKKEREEGRNKYATRTAWLNIYFIHWIRYVDIKRNSSPSKSTIVQLNKKKKG